MPKYDLNYRPSTYWETPDALLANIKGEHRRQAVRRLLEAGDVERLEDWLLREELSEDERKAVSRVHPALMGGEYLPSYEPGEVEIARVALRSTTADVISVRARRDGELIEYRVVDEYETRYSCTPSSSTSPLTFAELITLIDSAEDEGGQRGLTTRFLDFNADGGSFPESLDDFVTVTSMFYPHAEHYYRETTQVWLASKRKASGAQARQDQSRHRLDWPTWTIAGCTTATLVVLGVLSKATSDRLVGGVFIILLAVVCAIEVRYRVIPDRITIPSVGLGLVLNGAFGRLPIVEPLLGVVIAGGVILLIIVASGGGMGGGNMKLNAMIGAFLGWKAALLATTLAVGIAVPIAWLSIRRQHGNNSMEFGPYQALAAAIALLFGDHVLSWYLGLNR